MARGASAVIGTDSQVGEEIRMILMDGNFTFVDTSLRHVITQDDINAAYGGTFIYLPFSTTPELLIGDYMVGCQRLSGTGRVSVATSGNCVPGAKAGGVCSSSGTTLTTLAGWSTTHTSGEGWNGGGAASCGTTLAIPWDCASHGSMGGSPCAASALAAAPPS